VTHGTARSRIATCPGLVLAIVLVAAGAQGSVHGSAPAEDRLSLRVSPLVSFDPGFVEIDIRYNPDKRDRALIIEIDAEQLFRSSTIALGGADPPGSRWLRFEGLPAGNYSVHVLLDRGGHVVTAGESWFRVVGTLDNEVAGRGARPDHRQRPCSAHSIAHQPAPSAPARTS
jgi:hypothetical protein